MISINEVFKFLSIPTKRRIIMHIYLCQCINCSVSELCFSVDGKQANVSKHLMDLKKSKIVFFVKNKQSSRYFLHKDFVNEYQFILDFIKNNEIEKCCCND